jgi:metallophosphoesterase (TIGR00282 family)
MKVLFIGDIVGEPGRKALSLSLNNIVDRYKIDFVVANVENAAGGFGITSKVAEELFTQGIHVMTSGNHVWDKKEVMDYLKRERRLLRPANYPEGIIGYGSGVFETLYGDKIGIINLSGRVFMGTFDDPFRVAKKEIEKLKEETNTILIDFHAEATSEKLALGWYLDGEVAAVIGTHTHVQTADEQILPNGTAYITDLGMTGPSLSVIGIKKEQAIERFLFQMPIRFEIAKGPLQFNGVIIEIDEEKGLATAIQRLQMKLW